MTTISKKAALTFVGAAAVALTLATPLTASAETGKVYASGGCSANVATNIYPADESNYRLFAIEAHGTCTAINGSYQQAALKLTVTCNGASTKSAYWYATGQNPYKVDGATSGHFLANAKCTGRALLGYWSGQGYVWGTPLDLTISNDIG